MFEKKFLQEAVRLACRTAQQGGFPYGAIIVKDDEIVGRSNVEAKPFDVTAHAEITAVQNACANLQTADLSGCVIYSSCYPCSMCLGAIKWAGIKELYYAVGKNDAQKMGRFDEIFADDKAPLTAVRSADEDFVEFMQDCYNKKFPKNAEH